MSGTSGTVSTDSQLLTEFQDGQPAGSITPKDVRDIIVSETAHITSAINAALPPASATAPVISGIAAVGTSTAYARADHAHPTDLLYIHQFGSAGSGVSDDAPVINAAISAISAAGGGILNLPAGVFLTSGTITLLSNVIIQGAGESATIIRAAPNTTHVILQTANFSSLTGSSSATVGDGPYKFGLRDLGVDGNSTNRSGATANAVNIYGYRYVIENVEVYGSPGVNFYSEWATGSTFVNSRSPSNEFMESYITNLKTFKAVGRGISFFGPHDSYFTNCESYINGAEGAYFGATGGVNSAGGTLLNGFHSYGNSSTGIVIATSILTSSMESENNIGAGTVGINVVSPGALFGTNVLTWGNPGVGLILGNNFSQISNVKSYQNGGDGVQINGAANILSNVVSFSNTGTANGVTISSSGSSSLLTGVRAYSNAGVGVSIGCSLISVGEVNATGNTGGGVSLASGVGSVKLSAYLQGNGTSAAQLILNSPGANNMIDAVIYTSGTQVAYSGSPNAVGSYRISCWGVDFRSLQQAQGPVLDSTGQRISLGATYTVPSNCSLVRFASAVATSTVTLPTAIADGQIIQFVNYGTAITSLTFSPSVNGWTNASALAAFTGMRIRWDTTAAAWYREQ